MLKLLLNQISYGGSISSLHKDHKYSMSISSAVLHRDAIMVFRNGRRPLYMYSDSSGTNIALSTREIGIRSGLETNLISPIDFNTMSILSNGSIDANLHRVTDDEDWQAPTGMVQ